MALPLLLDWNLSEVSEAQARRASLQNVTAAYKAAASRCSVLGEPKTVCAIARANNRHVGRCRTPSEQENPAIAGSSWSRRPDSNRRPAIYE
jgi:hypothetical protein